MTHDVSVFFFVLGAFGKWQRDSVFVLDGNGSSCGDCSDWKETLLVWSFRSSFVGATWCQSTRRCSYFRVELYRFSQKTQGVFGDHPQNMSFVVNEVLKENHLESSVVM